MSESRRFNGLLARPIQGEIEAFLHGGDWTDQGLMSS
jgi:hypothetical protein